MKTTKAIRFGKSVAVLTLLCASAACGGGGGGSDETVQISGKAVLPDGVIGGGGPVANQPFQVLDLERVPDEFEVATGNTDADGNYTVQIGQTKAVAVVVNGIVRVSGLTVAESGATKDFDAVTDVACEAGVTAIVEGAVQIEDFGAEEIAILETAAAEVIAEGGVDFNDPASVTAAAVKVRERTNDGRQLPE
jgi:hypothetical protein